MCSLYLCAVILGDTCDSTGMIDLSMEADVLVHEATNENDHYVKCVENGHSTSGMSVCMYVCMCVCVLEFQLIVVYGNWIFCFANILQIATPNKNSSCWLLLPLLITVYNEVVIMYVSLRLCSYTMDLFILW